MVNEGIRERLPALQKVNKKKLKAEVKRVNQVLEKMDTEEITNTNDFIYAGAVVVTEELGLRGKKRVTSITANVEAKIGVPNQRFET